MKPILLILSIILFFDIPPCTAQTLEKIENIDFEKPFLDATFLDKDSTFWAFVINDSVPKGFLKKRSSKKNILKYDGSKWEIINPDIIAPNLDFDLFIDKKGDIWGITNESLLKYVHGKFEKIISQSFEGIQFVDSNNNFWLTGNEPGKEGMLMRYDGNNLVSYPVTINTNKKPVEWTSIKEDVKGNIWLFNRSFQKQINYNVIGVIKFYDYCGYKFSNDSLVKFDGLTEDYKNCRDNLMVFNIEPLPKMIFTTKTTFSIYSISNGNCKTFEKINEIPLKTFDREITDSEGYNYFLIGEKKLFQFKGNEFQKINLDSLIGGKDLSIRLALYTKDGFWFTTKGAILRYFNDKWHVFKDSEFNTNNILQKNPLNVYDIHAMDDNSVLFSTNTGIFQWKSEEWKNLMPDILQNLVVYSAKKIKNSVYFCTNLGVFMWNQEQWSQIITQFALLKDLVYKIDFVNDYTILKYDNDACSIIKGKKCNHYVLNKDKNLGGKVYKGYGAAKILSSDSLWITICKNSLGTAFKLGIYSFLTGDWTYQDIPSGNRSFTSRVIYKPGSNQFIWFRQFFQKSLYEPEYGLCKFNGKTIEPFNNQKFENVIVLLIDNNDVYFFSTEGFWKLKFDTPITSE
jgi:hypothetical protein